MKPSPISWFRWLSHPVFKVTGLGALSWFAYLHLTVSYPLPAFVAKYPLTDFGRANGWSYLTLLDFGISLFGAFILYVLAWMVVRRHPRDRRLFWIVLLFSALFALTPLVMYPITATDIFEYVFHSRILTHYGANPLTTPPIAFKGDPFLKTVNWAVQPSPYGPLWLLLTVPGSLLAGNDLLLNLFMMKSLAAIFYIASVVVVAAILRTIDPAHKAAGTLLFAWNPLILFETADNGHNDIIMMFFVLVAIYLLVRKQWLGVLPFLVASILVKYITAILFLPFLIYCLQSQPSGRARWVFLGKTGALSAVVAALITLPFLAVPSGLVDEANFYSLLAVPTLGYQFLKTIHGDKIAKALTLAISSGAYVALYLASLRLQMRARSWRMLGVLSTWLTLAYLVVGSMHFQPWFVVWPVALGIWVGHAHTRRVLLAFSASALLSYVANFVWVWNIRALQNSQVNLMFVMVIFAPPVIVGLLSYLCELLFGMEHDRAALYPERVRSYDAGSIE